MSQPKPPLLPAHDCNRGPAVARPGAKRRRLLLAQALGMAAAALCRPVQAQADYPARPVRMVVPYAAGGPLDGLVRVVADRLGKRLSQTVLVDNRAGASGILGADHVAKSPPDGHTLLATVIDTQVNNLALFRQLPYDPVRDFAPVTVLAFAPAILVVNPDVPAQTLPELLAWAKAQRGKVSYGSWGAGGLGHALAESLNRRHDLAMVHAPYRGEAPLVQDLLGRNVQLGFASIANTAQHIQRGALKAIAVSGGARSPAMPQVPTLTEAGEATPIAAARLWLGLLAPARTPAAIVHRLQQEVRLVLQEPEVAGLLSGRGFEPSGIGPAEFEAQLRRDLEVIPRLLKDIGVEAQ